MAKRKYEQTEQEQASDLVDRLIAEDPARISRFLKVIRDANALELDDPDLLLDWLALRDEYGNVVLATEEITARIGKYQSLMDALKPNTPPAN
jgi:hypothetical protein